jgi:misacylated tRNA(Ala) deacylase
MTDLVYQTDSYRRELSGIVTDVDLANRGIVLDQTVFYPGGGGQPADRGKLWADKAEYPVERVKKIGDQVFHYLAGEYPVPEVGSIIRGEIDWNRRYQLMRTHTAMHILCGVIFRDYGASVTGGDMDPLQGRMDFEFEMLQRELVEEIQNAVNTEVGQARPIEVKILPRDKAFQIPDLIRTKINLLPEGITQVRVVNIHGLDQQADGGTHVANTSEVGLIKIVDYKSKGKLNKRIYIEVRESKTP